VRSITTWSVRDEDGQRAAAVAAIRRLYCEVLPLWRACRRGSCRRHRLCIGEARACLARVWALLPEELQRQAQDQVIAGGPRRLPPESRLESELRRFPASNFVH